MAVAVGRVVAIAHGALDWGVRDLPCPIAACCAQGAALTWAVNTQRSSECYR